MRFGPVRVGQLSRLIPAASKKMLAQNLRRLEADGIVVRRDLSEIVLHVEYDFNPEAREQACSLLDHLAQWGRLYATSRATLSEGVEPPAK
jgi:DNA-binding HxlR family transcriptional regulator